MIVGVPSDIGVVVHAKAVSHFVCNDITGEGRR